MGSYGWRIWVQGLYVVCQAGEIVLSEPEVRQVTLPATGGRVIIASDGLWDAVAPKTAAHHVRGMPATKASRELGQVHPFPP
jgi:serine/threonine protein phosphatase PrpC